MKITVEIKHCDFANLYIDVRHNEELASASQLDLLHYIRNGSRCNRKHFVLYFPEHYLRVANRRKVKDMLLAIQNKKGSIEQVDVITADPYILQSFEGAALYEENNNEQYKTVPVGWDLSEIQSVLLGNSFINAFSVDTEILM